LWALLVLKAHHSDVQTMSLHYTTKSFLHRGLVCLIPVYQTLYRFRMHSRCTMCDSIHIVWHATYARNHAITHLRFKNIYICVYIHVCTYICVYTYICIQTQYNPTGYARCKKQKTEPRHQNIPAY